MATSNSSTKNPRRAKCRNVGNYILGKTLGEGTFGKVKLGTYKLTGERVAVKILEKARIADVADVERVTREIHILKLIRHPNIIQLYEIIETPRQLYLIMEYADGGELFDYIVACTRVKENEACRFFQQILAGVEYIHKIGIVHRDLKPENLLLDHNKNIKIVDFGLSNTYRSEELLKTACGSPCYAAPEMIAGNNYVPSRVDIWSCGVILFALICGYLPFEDPNTSKLYKKILAGDYKAPNFISESAKDLLSKVLNTDPETRYTIQQIKEHPWYKQARQELGQGIMIGYDPIAVDTSLLEELTALNFDVVQAQRCLEANKHNHLTTAYYLLLKKHLRNGGVSIADISQDCIDPRTYNSRKITLNDTLNSLPDCAKTFTPHPPLPKFSFEEYCGTQPQRRGRYQSAKRAATSMNAENIGATYDKAHTRGSSLNTWKSKKLTLTISSRNDTPNNKAASIRGTPRPFSNNRRRRNRSNFGIPSPANKENRRMTPKSERPNMSFESKNVRITKGSIQVPTHKNPTEILHSVIKTLDDSQIQYRFTDKGRIKCQKKKVHFNIEVMHFEGQYNKFCLNLKRLAGDPWEYKELCGALISSMALQIPNSFQTKYILTQTPLDDIS